MEWEVSRGCKPDRRACEELTETTAEAGAPGKPGAHWARAVAPATWKSPAADTAATLGPPASEGHLALRPTWLTLDPLSWAGLASFGGPRSANEGCRPVTLPCQPLAANATPAPTRPQSDPGLSCSNGNPCTWMMVPNRPSLVGAVEASTKAHFVAEAVPRGTTLFQ